MVVDADVDVSALHVFKMLKSARISVFHKRIERYIQASHHTFVSGLSHALQHSDLFLFFAAISFEIVQRPTVHGHTIDSVRH